MAASIALASCEAPSVFDSSPVESSGNVTLHFQPTTKDVTRAAISGYFTKLNVQLFDAAGQKVFDKMKTQQSSDADFGSLSVALSPGTYTVVAVGHSSTNSATIKSPVDVRFTASNGEKLTDTFCACATVTVSDASASDHTLEMARATAMVQFVLTDTDIPSTFAYFKMEYTGGSANFNPTTMQGITKSTQSEQRLRNSLMTHQCYTFPYMATTGTLKMTVSALASDGSVIRQRVFESVPVTRNRITTYTGPLFSEGTGEITQTGFGFVVQTDWEGEDCYEF